MGYRHTLGENDDVDDEDPTSLVVWQKTKTRPIEKSRVAITWMMVMLMEQLDNDDDNDDDDDEDDESYDDDRYNENCDDDDHHHNNVDGYDADNETYHRVASLVCRYCVVRQCCP